MERRAKNFGRLAKCSPGSPLPIRAASMSVRHVQLDDYRASRLYAALEKVGRSIN
jgi:hypothetical protein